MLGLSKKRNNVDRVVTFSIGIILIIGCGSSPDDTFYEIDISKPTEGDKLTLPADIEVQATNIPVERNSDPEWYMVENTLQWTFTSLPWLELEATQSGGRLSNHVLYSNNDQFGDHTVAVRFEDKEAVTQVNGVTIQIFFRRDDWKSGGDGPNWYYYWKQGNVVSDLASFSHTSENIYGKFESGVLYVGNLAPTENSSFVVQNRNTSQTVLIGADGSGIYCCAETCAHELEHKQNSGLLGADSDGDGLPDSYEESSPYNLDPGYPDTYNIAGATGYPDYYRYGDEEFIARLAEQYPGTVYPGKDWSDTNGQNWGD